MSSQRSALHNWYRVLIVVVIGGLAYLPSIQGFGYFNDDWYLMYAANAAGGEAFAGIYSIDRPARAVVMSIAYGLFGLDPLPYNISAFIFRLLGALTFLWILQKLWRRQRTAATVMALLFFVYPGFLSTPNAIDYQAQQVSLFLAMVSMAASLQAIIARKPIVTIVLWLLSALTAIAYLSLVEYFLGLEAFRLGIFAVLGLRKPDKTLWQRMSQVVLRYLPFSAGALGFFIWRFFFFESARKATDLGAQFSQFTDSPIWTLIRWGITVLQDSFEATFLAWGVPLTAVWGVSLRLREMLWAGLLVALAIALTWLLFRPGTQTNGGETAQNGETPWHAEAAWLGLAVILSGFVPVALVNREANFFYFSRYMLASSLGVAIFLVAVIFRFKGQMARFAAVALLLTTSLLTHHLNGKLATRITDSTRAFWWQVYWRIPQLQPGTTLVANYSHASIEEDYFVWGPANLIYHPESTNPQRLEPAIWSAVLTRDNLLAIQLGGNPKAINRRSITTTMDYGNVLIVSQPTSVSCVQVLDGNLPALSEYEQYDIALAASASNPDLILLHGTAPPPPEIIFGPEPEQDWCYYYEKASLAYQQGDWQTVVNLGQKARKKGFSAADPVEWMPFLQAAAFLDEQQELLDLAPKVKRSPYLESLACRLLTKTAGVSIETKQLIEEIFCIDQ